MKATLKSFSKSTKYEGKVVITVTNEAVDEVTGLVTQVQRHYIVVPDYYYKGLVGKEVENNQEILTYIKDKLPDCYICNLDGKVIIANK